MPRGKLGKLDMMKSITRKMLTSTMDFSWDTIKAGERIVAFAESWGAKDQHAGFAELSMRQAGTVVTIAGERLELVVNGLALWLGYNDGEVSGMVVWPELAR